MAELLKEEIADILTSIKDPRIGFVTITDVEVSPDLSSTRVFVSIFEEPEKQAQTLEGLKSAEGYARRELGKRIRLKKTPKINFIPDKGIERGVKLVKLIDEIAPPENDQEEKDEETHEEKPG